MIKKDYHEILGKIPRRLTIAGIIICLLSIGAIIYAAWVLFY